MARIDLHYTEDPQFEFDADLIAELVADQHAENIVDATSYRYFSMAGMSADVVGSAFSSALAESPTRFVFLGRPHVVDPVVTQICQDRTFRPCVPGLHAQGWWRGLLIVRALHGDFPGNEGWLMELDAAFNGEVRTFSRLVDNSLVP